MLLLLLGCSGSGCAPPPPVTETRAAPARAGEASAEARTCWAGQAPPPVCVAPAWPRARFSRAVWFGAAPGDPEHHFVVEQDGRIRLLAGEDAAGAPLWADLTDRVSREGNEEGLLGMAFHPGYAENRRVFLYYRSSRHSRRSTVLSEFRVEGAAPGRLVLESEREILVVRQFAGNHNGGSLLFGPDGYLYLGLGDGGGGGDPQQNGQDTDTILGGVIRLDIDNYTETHPYSVPSDNPFAATPDQGRPELWAWGLRNPWRMAFDPANGTLWAGDVGQGRFEEIDRIVRGGNYGWNVVEGASCYQAETCETAGFQDPVWVYGRNAGVSVTGGEVYRAGAVPALVGTYLYADFGSRRLWGLCADPANPPTRAAELLMAPLNVSSFGLDAAGEVVIVGFGRDGDGQLFRLKPEGDPECSG